jgi:hypothetical protein
MLEALQLVATLSAALFAGAAIYINVAEHPARMRLDTRSAAAQWAPSYQRATWMQAPLAMVSFLAGVSAWLVGGGLLWLVAALFIGAVVPITFTLIMPTNRQLQAWGRLHGLRSAASVVATLLMLWGLV